MLIKLRWQSIVLAHDHNSMQRLDVFVDNEADESAQNTSGISPNWKSNVLSITSGCDLPPAEPKPFFVIYLRALTFWRSTKGLEYDMHLFIEIDGKFRADLGLRKGKVLQDDCADSAIAGWLWKVDRKPWSLEILYPDFGRLNRYFPDLIEVRKDGKGFNSTYWSVHPAANNNSGDRQAC
jgi:type III restriction enzyme